MKTIWLSFANPDAESKETSFLGVAIVDITKEEEEAAGRLYPDMREGGATIVAATIKARDMGCNPGGEVKGLELDPNQPIRDEHKNTLMSREELREAGFISSEIVELSQRTLH